MEEQEDDELPPLAERRAARCQPLRETRIERLEHHLDMLTELVSTLVAVLGQNAVNVALAIPLANAEGEDATSSKAHTSQRRRRVRCKCRNIARLAQEDRELTPESRQTERTFWICLRIRFIWICFWEPQAIHS